ncbi:MAG: hypothetical protein Q8R91_10470 [Candidatus Omnitrophota bacterium]|nr:hypothetical protein [Candidatus Omnitrophota bacterium]
MPRARRLLLLVSSGLWLVPAAAAADSLNRQLAAQLQLVHVERDAVRQAIIRRLDQQLGIRYDALERLYGDRERLYRRQLSIAGSSPSGSPSPPRIQPLDPLFAIPEYRWYTEARLLLDHQMVRNHFLQAKSLHAYEEILEALIDEEPIFRHLFRSPEARRQYGLLLTQVVWELPGAESASTRPLDAYTVFADRTQMPFLIRLSATAFTSLAFLRSIVVHELNHVLLYKQPRITALEQMAPQHGSRAPTQPIPSPYSLSFNRRYGRTPHYQYHLLHEYYSFKAQLLYDDLAPVSPYYRLSGADRQHIERLYEWAWRELDERHRAFVEREPDPPVVAYLQRFPPPPP